MPRIKLSFRWHTAIIIGVLGLTYNLKTEYQNSRIQVLNVAIFCENDYLISIQALLRDLIPAAAKLRNANKSELSKIKGNSIQDPRDMLYFFWDRLSTKELNFALSELGFKANCTPAAFILGEQPSWFSERKQYICPGPTAFITPNYAL